MYEIGFASIKPTKVYGAKSGTVNLIDLRCVQDVYRDGNKHYKTNDKFPKNLCE